MKVMGEFRHQKWRRISPFFDANTLGIRASFLLTLVCVFLQGTVALGEGEWEQTELELRKVQQRVYDEVQRARADGDDVLKRYPEHGELTAKMEALYRRLIEEKAKAGVLELDLSDLESWDLERSERAIRQLQHQLEAARAQFSDRPELETQSKTQMDRVRTAYLEKKRAALEVEETELKKAWAQLQEQGRTPEKVIDQITESLSQLTAEERETLATAKKDKDLVAFREKLGPSLEILEAFDGPQVEFEAKYDRFNLGKIEYLMNAYMETAERLHEATRADLSKKQRAKADEKMALMREYYATYQTNTSNGKMSENKFYFAGVKDFFIEFENYSAIASKPYTRNLKGYWARFQRFVEILRGPEISFALNFAAPWVTNFFRSSKNKKPNLIDMLKRSKNKQPVVEYTVEGVQRWAKSQGYSFRTVNSENLPPTPEPGGKEIIIYSPNHVHALLDAVTSVSQLGMKDYALFSGAMEWAPPILRKHLIDHPEFIVVGQGSKNPLARFKELNQTLGVTAGHLLPEGNLQSGVAYEMRALQDGYAKGVIALLRRQGYRITIVPSTAPNNFSLMNDTGKNNTMDSKDLVTEIHQPIPPEVVDLIMATGDPVRINRLIRAFYFGALDRHSPDGRFLQMPDLGTLIPALNERISLEFQCNGAYASVAKGMEGLLR